jgi:predicted PhzF superfamily epimerase YddE/YHI9
MGISAAVVNVFVDESGDHGNPLGIVWASASTKRHEQQIAADLGFSETVFIDDVHGTEARARIFTPTIELPFAGHPTVGLAAWLHAAGDDIASIVVPAGVARVRVDGDRTFVNAMPDWAPQFELTRFDSPADVDAVDPIAYASGSHYVWAWDDEASGTVRARMFAPALGVREDEATGAAAIRLTAELGRDLDIRQGEGSRLYTHRRYLGQQVEVGGRVSDERTVAVH